jgi:hypothetical protein
MSLTLSPLLLLLLLFGIAGIEWLVAGIKGVALLNRSPAFVLCCATEVVLGSLAGWVFYEAYASRDVLVIIPVTAATALGCMLGCSLSGAVKWRQR